MGFKLGNVEGRSALVNENNYYDLETISNGKISADGLEAIKSEELLSDLYSKLGDFEPTGNINDITLGAPISKSKNCFAVGLNYRNHAEESGMDINMEKLMKMHNQKTPDSKKILEINAEHPMIIKISDNLNVFDHKKISQIILDQANILDVNILSNPSGYMESLTELFIK